MRRREIGIALLFTGCVATIATWRSTPVHSASTPSAPHWNQQAAASYLDQRQIWWQNWPRAHKDHETLCISCHTQLPYALSRPALRHQLNQTEMAAPEQIMMASVEKRVSNWSEMVPFYSDALNGPGKTAEAHATEAVLNAIILASYDARQGHLRPITRTAFDNAWTLQEPSGAWKWQDFKLGPWEASESAYQGAALLMLKANSAPDGYAHEPAVREHLQSLQNYLQQNYATQPIMSQLYILWASSKTPGLLSTTDRKTLLTTLQSLQQPDGGWRLSTLDKKPRLDNSPEPQESDGMATALAVLAMEESGTSHRDTSLKRGVEWLEQHQQPEGDWRASSLNKHRDLDSDAGRFMTDAATGFAILALEKSH